MYTALPLQQIFGSGVGVVIRGDKESINAKTKPRKWLCHFRKNNNDKCMSDYVSHN